MSQSAEKPEIPVNHRGMKGLDITLGVFIQLLESLKVEYEYLGVTDDTELVGVGGISLIHKNLHEVKQIFIEPPKSHY